MTARLRWSAAALAMLAVFGVLGLAARGGEFTAAPAVGNGVPPTTAVSAQSGSPDQEAERERRIDEQNKALARIPVLRFTTLFYVAVALALLIGAVVFLIGYWREGDRRRRRRRAFVPPAVAPAVLPAAALDGALDAGVLRIEQGEAREAVVACWLLLVRAAADAGSAARPAETATEFAGRLAAEQAVSGPELRRLAELYREARFSEHRVGEEVRAKARRALSVLQADLRAGVAL